MILMFDPKSFLHKFSFTYLKNSYMFGQYWADFVRDYGESSLFKNQHVFQLVTDKKKIATFQAKHSPLGVLAEFPHFHCIQALLFNKSRKRFVAEGFMQVRNGEVPFVFIPVYFGKIVTLYSYYYSVLSGVYDFPYGFAPKNVSLDSYVKRFASSVLGVSDKNIGNIHELGTFWESPVIADYPVKVFAARVSDFSLKKFAGISGGKQLIDIQAFSVNDFYSMAFHNDSAHASSLMLSSLGYLDKFGKDACASLYKEIVLANRNLSVSHISDHSDTFSSDMDSDATSSAKDEEPKDKMSIADNPKPDNIIKIEKFSK